jgi:hypothetical protein
MIVVSIVSKKQTISAHAMIANFESGAKTIQPLVKILKESGCNHPKFASDLT